MFQPLALISTDFSLFSLRKTVGKECSRFWLSLRHIVILISNVRTLTLKKINQMALISTLTELTTAFERAKEKIYGFQQTVLKAGFYRL